MVKLLNFWKQKTAAMFVQCQNIEAKHLYNMLISCVSFQFIYILIDFMFLEIWTHLLNTWSQPYSPVLAVCMHACMYDKAAPESNQHIKCSDYELLHSPFKSLLLHTKSMRASQRAEKKNKSQGNDFDLHLFTVYSSDALQTEKIMSGSFISFIFKMVCCARSGFYTEQKEKMFDLWRNNIQTVYLLLRLKKCCKQTSGFWRNKFTITAGFTHVESVSCGCSSSGCMTPPCGFNKCLIIQTRRIHLNRDMLPFGFIIFFKQFTWQCILLVVWN